MKYCTKLAVKSEKGRSGKMINFTAREIDSYLYNIEISNSGVGEYL